MATQTNPKSPGGRPQLTERSLSARSLSKEGPGTGNLNNTHKGSSSKLHKTHTVGHGRHGHNRVPSYGKGLNKLTKLTPIHAAEDAGNAKHHARSASHTPSTSPRVLSDKRNSSTTTLNRPSSKGSIKKNASHPNLTHNPSSAKIGNKQKSEKAQIKKSLFKKGTNDAPLQGMARFELGDMDDVARDDDWTDSGSQSPVTTRTYSRQKTPTTAAPKELPTPDEPPEPRSPQLPDSPPESLRSDGDREKSTLQVRKTRPEVNGAPRNNNTFSHPPDVQAVTSRLISRNGTQAIPTTTNVSANITPQHIGSPNLSHSNGFANLNEPSMPSDGISRFLPGSKSNSGSGTPGSVSQLQQNLASFDRSSHHSSSPDDKASALRIKADARRAKSAVDLTNGQARNRDSPLPEKPPSLENTTEHQPSQKAKLQQSHLPSPFESARGANPRAGKSYTQLKLNLDREAVSRDPPISKHPVLMNVNKGGSVLNMASSIPSSATEMEKRIKRQYAQAQRDVSNSKKYYPDAIVGKIPGRAVRRHEMSERGKERRGREKGKRDGNTISEDAARGGPQTNGGKSATNGADEAVARNGKVRFEIGGARSPDELTRDGGRLGLDGADDEGVHGLLRRMWMAQEPRAEEMEQ